MNENNAPLTLRDIGCYLIGRRESIEKVAADRNSLWYGLVFVLFAGFCREYDQELIGQRFDLYLLPLWASFVMCCWMYIFCRFVYEKNAIGSFRTFLSLFWMAAPCAFFYAIPVEKFGSYEDAALANLWLLFIVASWRVWLFCRAMNLLTKRSILIPVLLASCCIIVPAGRFRALKNLTGMMSGAINSPVESMVKTFAVLLMMAAMLVGFCVFFLYVRLLWKRKSFEFISLPVAAEKIVNKNIFLSTLVLSIVLFVMMVPAQQKLKNLFALKELMYSKPLAAEKMARRLTPKNLARTHSLQPKIYSYDMLSSAAGIFISLKSDTPVWYKKEVLHYVRVILNQQDFENRSIDLSEQQIVALQSMKAYPQIIELFAVRTSNWPQKKPNSEKEGAGAK